MPRKKKIDMQFLAIIIALVVVGFVIFLSAALGITAHSSVKYSSILMNQLVLGLLGGTIVATLIAHIPYQKLRMFSFWIFVGSILVALLVFVPGIGFESGGAKRWIIIGSQSFQPAELLKLGFILYFATWLSMIGKKGVRTIKEGVIPYAIMAGIVAAILLAQPDTGTLLVILIATGSMYFVAGARWSHILIVMLIAIIGLTSLVFMRPYIKDRIMTFFDPAANSLTTGYQIQQSLIAIGSGGITGRGFGQSLQKFNFLPEPIGDSIFAVAAEEFGFFGALVLIALFFAFAWKGLKIAAAAPDTFGRLVAVGLVILITTQSFGNMAAMLGIIPLSGMPLLFVSHGGTALFFTLVAVGILLNISRYQKTT